MIGETLNDKYEIVRRLGVGGMGAVYEALRTDTRERVAVKVISTGDLARDKALVARFQREARAAGAIETRHIVRLLDTGTDAGQDRPFMVMEYLAGEDLGQLFQRVGLLPPALAIRIGAQVCAGLEKAHEAHIVHRDVKPANIFLARGEDGSVTVKILDFGIAKIKMDQAQGADAAGLTRTGSMLGSPLYMSPEQARGSKGIDHRADIWSLGVVLYQALTGRTPHHDIDAIGELIIAICSEAARPVQDLAPWVPPELAEIVHRALRFEPGERFQTAGEMRAALALHVDGTEIDLGMLVGVSPETRAEVAPRAKLVTTGGGPAPLSSSRPAAAAATNDADLAMAQTDIAPAEQLPSRPSPGPPAASREAPATTRRPVRAAPLQRPFAIGGAVVVAAALGFGAYALLAVPPPPTQAPASAAPAASTAPAATTVPAAATASEAAAASAAAAAPKPRNVKLVIVPSNASVEVDGVRVKAVDSVVEITGPIESKHRVRLSKDGAESVTEVTITDSGAAPPKVELVGTKPKPSGSAAPKP